MSEVTNRAAIIIYTPNPSDANDMLILVGVSRYGITTIGGGKKDNEQEIRCCIRECYEETRHLINFESARILLKQAKTFKYEKCVYYVVPGFYDDMQSYCKEFPNIKIDDNPASETNEMLELRMVSANQLIKNFVMQNYTDEDKVHTYTRAFISMFMDVGYDKLRNNAHNHYTININMPVKLNTSLIDLPPIVSVSILKHGLPIIYGMLYNNRNDEENSDEISDNQQLPVLYMSSQFYYDTPTESVFRNYIIRNGVTTTYGV